MPGILLMVSFFLIRFGLLLALDKNSMKRAAYFPPLCGGEIAAYWLYQLSNVAILVCLIFSKIHLAPPLLFWPGLGLYLAGTLLLALSIIHFAAPTEKGINQNGLYRFSRNPMYIAYFVFFIGCVLLTHSLWLLGSVLVFQITAHWIILSEERWCVAQFGDAYRQYMARVRRYF